MSSLNIPNLNGTTAADAATTLDMGPASDTAAMPDRAPLLNRAGLTGVGFPYPNPTNASMAVPMGSRCERGFRVSRPSSFAVWSPSRLAVSAWLNSWTVIAPTMATANPKSVTTARVGES